MNEENSYESDLSEGWSLIDINLNEEPMNTSETESLVENEKGLLPDSEDPKLKRARSLQTFYFFNNILKNEVESTRSILNKCRSNGSPPNQETLSNTNEILTEGKDPALSEPINDSCDAESIEILDTEGNDQDSGMGNVNVILIEKLDFDGFDHASNNESFFDDFNTHHFSGLRRKRRKLSRDSESSIENFDNGIASFDGGHSRKTQVVKIQTCKHHVYRHYRNNVANTVLNLTMRVIFAGVACMAIGHFLGVHDGEGTAGELYDTLKKVQMENVALQSRLSQLNRAFTREAASKWESTSNKPACNLNSNIEWEKSGTDQTPQPEIQPNPNSVEWLLKVHKLVQKGCKNNEVVDPTKITDYIHDLLTFLRRDKKEENKIQDLEETNAKISKLLQKMVVKLSSSQENLENLYSRFLKLKDKFNKKVSKLFPDLADEYGCRGQQCDGLNSNSDKNLNPIQWNPVGKTTQSTILTDNSKPNPEKTVSFCVFPQSEEYYLEESENFPKKVNTTSGVDVEEGIDDGNINEKETPENGKVISEVEEETLKEGKKSDETEEKEKEDEIAVKQNEKEVSGGKTKLNERDTKAKQKSKAEKVKRDDKVSKKKFDNSDSKEKHSKKTKRGSGEGKGNVKKHFKAKKHVVRQEIKVGKRKRKSLNFPNEFWTKKGKQEVWFDPEQFSGSRFYPKDEFNTGNRIVNGKFVNFTGDWFFRLSKGRDEVRRQEILSDWQFERAKARMGWRNGDKFNTNWQFLRAVAREDGRMEKISNNRK